MKPSKIEKLIAFFLMKVAVIHRPGTATLVAVWFYRRWGMKFHGQPNYISKYCHIDGTDYGLIEIGEGTTISSYIRILTHDWSPDTILRGFGLKPDSPIGRTLPVSIGKYCFIGTGSVVMPGAVIGDCSIIGAGTVVRGTIAPYSIVIGSPGVKVGDTRDYIQKRFPEHWDSLSEDAKASLPQAPTHE